MLSREIARLTQGLPSLAQTFLIWVFIFEVVTAWNPGLATAKTVGSASFQQIMQAQSAIEDEEYDLASDILKKLLVRRLLPSGRALALQLSSRVHAARGDYSMAAQALEAALETGSLDAEMGRVVHFNLARMTLAAGNAEQCIAVLEEWFKDARKPAPQAYMLLAQAYSQKQDYGKAVVPAKRAIELLNEPRQNWYQLLVSLHYELDEIRPMADALQFMVSQWPDRDRYWKQLAWAYGALEDWPKMLAVLELAHKRGNIEAEAELVRLARLYLHEGVPVRAIHILKVGLNNGRIATTVENLSLLADALARAEDEYAVVEVLEQASHMPNGGALHLRLARAYLADEQWRNAAKSARNAVENGPAEQMGKSFLLLGIAEFRSGEIKAARDAFVESSQHKATNGTAVSWLKRLPPV